MNIIGISALYHDSACCLLQDGKLVAAVQEERFSRKKNDSSMPVNAFKYCLREGNILITDVDCIAYYEIPEKKLARQLWSGYNYYDKKLKDVLNPKNAENKIREILGYEGPIKFYEHHLSHAASSFFYSGFESSAILTVDGVGEWATTTYGIAKGKNIELFEEVHFPDSIGLLYSAITSYLGFRVNNDEYKVMGLAPYGQPLYIDPLRKLLKNLDNGQYELDMKYFDFINGERMYSRHLIELLKEKPRKSESEIRQFHKDVSRSLQYVLEEFLLEKTKYLHSKTGNKNLCLAGGVALNCVANGKILSEGPFENMFIQPAAGDAGGALGAAALAHVELIGNRDGFRKMEHAYLGPEYSNKEILNILDSTSLKIKNFQNDSDSFLKEVAKRIADGKVIGWFQGKLEFGPRALGARSILADPRDPDMRVKINAMVKMREAFRPFAPTVLESKAHEHFDIDHPSPFMLETCQVISKLKMPAITHIDNSARIQTINPKTNLKYSKLIEEFEKLTGCPMVLNTSFNVRGQPNIRTPEDAIICFIKTGIDSLAIGDFIIDKTDNSIEVLQIILQNFHNFVKSEINNDVYTFI